MRVCKSEQGIYKLSEYFQNINISISRRHEWKRQWNAERCVWSKNRTRRYIFDYLGVTQKLPTIRTGIGTIDL